MSGRVFDFFAAFPTNGRLRTGTQCGLAFGGASLLAVFRHRNYRLFFTGQLISLMGSWMQNTAMPWLVYSLTHSTVLLGVTSFCAMVPVFLVTPFGGMVADRVDRRKFLLLTQSLAMLQAATLAVLTLTGMVRVWEIICLALTMGLINSFEVLEVAQARGNAARGLNLGVGALISAVPADPTAQNRRS